MAKFHYSIYLDEEDLNKLDAVAGFSHVDRSKLIRLLIRAAYATLENLEATSPGIKEHLAGLRVVNHRRGKREETIPWLEPWFDVELIHKKITKWRMAYFVDKEPNHARQAVLTTDIPALPPGEVFEKYLIENNLSQEDVLHVYMSRFFKKPQDAVGSLVDLAKFSAEDLLKFFKDENLTKEDLVKAYADQQHRSGIMNELAKLYPNRKMFVEEVLRIAGIDPQDLYATRENQYDSELQRYKEPEQPRGRVIYKNRFEEWGNKLLDLLGLD